MVKEIKDNYIHINKEYAIQGDSTCVTLYRKRIVKKSGKVQLDAIGYFPSLTQALNRLIDMDLGEQKSLDLILSRIDELKKIIAHKLFELCELKQE